MKQPLVFLPTSLCAADTTESESDLKELFQDLELSLTWRSKPMRLQTLSRKWKRDYWMRVLCSRISSSFRIENYVTKLPSCQQVFHVSPSPVQGNDKQQKTHDTCGLGSQMELQLCDHDMFGLKMSKESSQLKQQTENRYLNMSSETWKKEVTRVRGEYSQRLKSVHHTKENESSSLGSYPTPTSRDWKGKQANEYKDERGEENNVKFASLPGVVDKLAKQNWATPQASDHVEGARTATESNQKCLGRDLARLDGPQDQVSSSTSGKNQGSPKLNPAWVCQLMGLPSGWTNLGCWATE